MRFSRLEAKGCLFVRLFFCVCVTVCMTNHIPGKHVLRPSHESILSPEEWEGEQVQWHNLPRNEVIIN